MAAMDTVADPVGKGPRVMPTGYQMQDGEDPLAAYFAVQPASNVIDELKSRTINHWNALQNRGLPTLWRLSYAQAFGLDPNTGANATQRLQFLGPQQNYIRFRVQLSRSHIKQRNVLAQGQRPSFHCVATNDDASSLAQTPIAGRVMTYIFREADGERVCYEALESDGYFGEGLIWCRWDPSGGDRERVVSREPALDPNTQQPIMVAGQPMTKRVVKSKPTGAPTYQSLFPWNVVREPHSRKSPWILTREKASKAELMARYPEKAEELKSLRLKRENEPGMIELYAWDVQSATDDVLAVKHFYHQNDASCPGGRYLGYVDDVVLWDLPCPVARGLPIISICSARYFDTPFGYPEACDLLALQEMIDELLSQSATNILRHGNQSLWAEDGVEFDEKKLAEGGAFFTLKSGQKPPAAIQWAELPEATKFMLEYLPQRMGEISGINSTMRGEPDTNIDSGVFASLMQSIAEKFISSTQAAYDFMLNDVGNTTLELVRANVDSRFAAEVSGESNTPYMQYFTADDFDGVKRVLVQRQSPVLNNIAGRFEVFEKIKDLPRDDRQAAVQLLTTGDTSAFIEDDLSCIVLIRKENEALARGQPAAVSPTDDHILHVQKHRSSLDRLRAQSVPSQVMPNGQINPAYAMRQAAMQMHMEHINQHALQWRRTDPVFAAVCAIPQPPMPDPMSGRLMPSVSGVPRSITQAAGRPTPQLQAPPPANSNAAPGGPAGGAPQLPASPRAQQARLPQANGGQGAGGARPQPIPVNG